MISPCDLLVSVFSFILSFILVRAHDRYIASALKLQHNMALAAPPPVYLSPPAPMAPRRPISWSIPRKPLPPNAQVEHVHKCASDLGMSFRTAAYTYDIPLQDYRSGDGSWTMLNAQNRGDISSRGSLDSIVMADTYSLASDRSPPSPWLRARSISRRSTATPDSRPLSWVDLLHSTYPQPGPVALGNNAHLRSAVGSNASLLSQRQTFDMYLANVKKTDDPAVQFEFALFLLSAMQDLSTEDPPNLLKQAKAILQRLADRSYPFAQYYLADGYASGLFSNNKDKEDYDRAFPLFVAASKHGHVEACYRAALCYEFGWGTRVEAARAAQFYRQAASKSHPGAMLRMAQACLTGDMGLGRKRYREGVKWMKRASESSDTQYNSAPYELGLLHETGYGDDVFPDVSYAAQLFTKSAELGHAEANYRLGDAYERGKLHCPRDPALSIHFYTGAAQQGHPMAMMALCAWYLVGAEPVLDRDDAEAYEWAKRAADLELPKAQYAVGYFTEMGIGCRPDAVEANGWYVRAADQGDGRAKQRIDKIRAVDGRSVPEKSKSLPPTLHIWVMANCVGGRRKWFRIF